MKKKKCRIQEEREERHKRKKNDPVGGGGYGDVDIPLSGRSSKSPCSTSSVFLLKV